MENKVNVYIKVSENGKLPSYGSLNAAGCDLYATKNMQIKPGETKVMPLNFIMAMDENLEAQIRPRSGLSLKTNLRVPNSPGTIDSDYRDTVGVILENTYNIANLTYDIVKDPSILKVLKKKYKEVSLFDYLNGKESINLDTNNLLSILNEKIYLDDKGNPYGTIYINKGERIAQMVFTKYKRANFIECENPQEIGENRGGGFGHTGVK
ncbi:aminotransferase [Clostridium sporogenes]|uniref:dUTP diphosphatase n=1 Tax=Clostridium botulinum TaxID=1491 RepID=A0A6M0SZV2_CLOBO|nr:aminotransferase [Clostridium sporogenes]NFA60485.1 aminotransferase [Clostridium botulinum]NFI72304.1 aminotransferase [Clostridium sporogenes]NFM24567.1 aminotransferase [Clostridium sporogenes]NFP60848.1 aminotransferase [Clostridium sporogenes]NFU94536.1 aminotransferase [Clostridium sporogenes]